ncbi:MAG: hypothetical protein ACI8RD_012367, partial [Bacillariaceae sp.]
WILVKMDRILLVMMKNNKKKITIIIIIKPKKCAPRQTDVRSI